MSSFISRLTRFSSRSPPFLQGRAGIHLSSRQTAAKIRPQTVVLATAGLGISLYLLAERPDVLLDSQAKVDKAQAEDPDAAPSGAKGSKEAGVVSNKTGHARFQKKGRDGYIPLKEVGGHDLAHDAWVVIDGEVWDVTNFLKSHPGGAKIILSNAGRDVTELYKPIHPPNTLENNLAPEQYIGRIDPKLAEETRKRYEVEVQRVQTAREGLPPVATILGLDEMQEAAEKVMSDKTKNYYNTGSLDEYTLSENRKTFNKCRFVPRVMVDVSAVYPQTKIFGQDSPLPIYISPASNALLGHPDGEFTLVRGAAKTGIFQGISAASSLPLHELLEEKDRLDDELGGRMNMGYQVYIQSEREKSEAQVREAVEGGVKALFLTVDTPVLGHRQKNEKVKGTVDDCSPGIRMDAHTDFPPYHDPRLNWDDLPKLKELAKGTPIYLKGVASIDDVRLAKEHGLAGVILSNHGGRQLDHTRTAIDALRQIHAEDPNLAKEIEIYIDGGIRRGSEVLMAKAFGARGVGLGRPFLWAQSAYGEQGVIRTIRILESEIVMAMRLLGITRLDQVGPQHVECIQEVWK
ncbi:hypothetical protein QFC20_000709 [Naganishia adeliensis]|uniref:Uncharacterized protein n=1 Tax=Naganishia adeliensis TaxID=92952 RepID=A0ACC2WY61_9TREE|nr:hypothetical protein QFC20_000709 [Naganishia adeliensis]